jgi:hypothetical protein
MVFQLRIGVLGGVSKGVGDGVLNGIEFFMESVDATVKVGQFTLKFISENLEVILRGYIGHLLRDGRLDKLLEILEHFFVRHSLFQYELNRHGKQGSVPVLFSAHLLLCEQDQHLFKLLNIRLRPSDGSNAEMTTVFGNDLWRGINALNDRRQCLHPLGLREASCNESVIDIN